MDEAELRGAWSVPADRSGVPTRVTLCDVPPRRPVRTCALVNQRRIISAIGALRSGSTTDRIATGGKLWPFVGRLVLGRTFLSRRPLFNRHFWSPRRSCTIAGGRALLVDGREPACRAQGRDAARAGSRPWISARVEPAAKEPISGSGCGWDVARQQPQAPPQQPPPPPAEGDGAAVPPRPVTATVDNSFTVSSWPCGQAAGTAASRIGRLTSNVSPQARHRYS